MIKILNKAKIVGIGLLLLSPLFSFAEETLDPTGIVVTFGANIIQQSCSVESNTSVVFDDIAIDSAGFGGAPGSTTAYQYFSLNVTCNAATTLSLKLTGNADIYEPPKYLKLDATCPETPCAGGFAVATYMTTAENTEPASSNLLTVGNDTFVNSLVTTPSTNFTLWFAANLVQTKQTGSVTAGTYTATGTLNVRYN